MKEVRNLIRWLLFCDADGVHGSNPYYQSHGTFANGLTGTAQREHIQGFQSFYMEARTGFWS